MPKQKTIRNLHFLAITQTLTTHRNDIPKATQIALLR